MTPIEIYPAPDLYAVEFEADGHLRASIILTATSSLTAMLKAWELCPEDKRLATGTRVYHVEYVKIDGETGHSIVVKGQESEIIPPFLS